MAYDEKLADRVREHFAKLKKVEEKKMFGGVCFMLNDKMCVGVSKEDLMVRFDPELQDEILEHNGVKPMDFTHKTMKGFVFVSPDGIRTKKELDYWINLALDFNPRAQASKKAKAKAKKKK
jgi:TfoX/Sxy family transcriptional regulator of competence genes